MLPPVPEDTLTANPLFKTLYENLTTKILNPEDLTTRSTSRSHHALDQELRTHRAELAKSQLLQRELDTVTTRSSGLPNELQEIIDLTTTPPRSLSDLPLLSGSIDDFHASLPALGEAISRSLSASALDIARIAYPEDTNPLILDSKIDLLPADTAHRRKTLLHTTETLSTMRASVATLTLQLLSTYTSLASITLNHTHSTLLPPVQKSIHAKSAHLAVVSSSMAGKLSVMRYEALQAIYDPEAADALENYRMHLHDTSSRLLARQRTVEEELKRYEKAGSDMKGLVEKYGAVMRGIEAVTKDIRRLGGKA